MREKLLRMLLCLPALVSLVGAATIQGPGPFDPNDDYYYWNMIDNASPARLPCCRSWGGLSLPLLRHPFGSHRTARRVLDHLCRYSPGSHHWPSGYCGRHHLWLLHHLCARLDFLRQ
jgi:hypothetical protein